MSTPQTGSTSKPFEYLLQRTIRACEVAKAAAAAAAEGIAAGSAASLDCIHELEKELDALDREIDAGVTLAITHPDDGEASVLLACMKFAICDQSGPYRRSAVEFFRQRSSRRQEP